MFETVASGLAYQQFTNGAEIHGTQVGANDPVPQTWRLFYFKYEDTVSADTADDQVFTMELANITGGQLDSTWTDGDYGGVIVQLQNLVGALAPLISPRLKCTEIRSYVRAFRPYFYATETFAPSGPPERVYSVNVPSTGTGDMPPQVSTSVTEMTPARTHWGRMYLPTLAHSAYAASGGRLANTATTTILSAVHACYDTLMAAEFYPVVPTSFINKAPGRTLQVVTNVRIDDVPDVHRSRRFASPLLKTTLPSITH